MESAKSQFIRKKASFGFSRKRFRDRKPKEYQMLDHSTDFVSTFLSQKAQIHDG